MPAVRQFFVEHLEPIAFWVSAGVAVGGLVALLLVWLRWPWLSRRYREVWAKCAVAFFRAVAALSAVAARGVETQPGQPLLEQPWVPTLALAAVGYLLWEFAGAIGDHKFKLAKEKAAADHQTQLDEANQDREDADFQALRLTWLLTHLRELVGEKLQRVRDGVRAKAGGRASIQQARDGLAPDEQVHVILEWLASLFHVEAVHADSGRYNQNFRVGLFAETDGRLAPLDAFDLATRRHDPFSSYTRHADRYRLDNDADPSHAVRCVREGRTIIVADCAADPGFEFFHDRQRQYLRSMIAHPLSGFCPDGVTPARAALLIDTDVPGFFREDDRETLELLLREFVARIDLEYAISGLTR